MHYPTWRKLLSFLLIGGGIFVLGQLLLFVLVDWLYWHPAPANALVLLASFWFSYHWNERYTWTGCVSRSTMRRFMVARTATVLLSFLLFNLAIISGVHYLWANALGVLAGTAVNYLVADRWVFKKVEAHQPALLAESLRIGWRTMVTVLGVMIAGSLLLYISAGDLFLPLLLVALTLPSTLMALFYLVTMLYAQRDAKSADNLKLRPPSGTFAERIAVLMPAKHEPPTYALTILNAAWTQRDHPDHRLFALVYDACRDRLQRGSDACADTTRAALAASQVIAQWHAQGGVSSFKQLKQMLASVLAQTIFDGSPLTEAEWRSIQTGRDEDALLQIMVCPLRPGQQPSKPLKLNYAFSQLKDEFTTFTILDAESMAAAGLLAHVDQALQDHPDTDIVQGPVQLVEPQFSGTVAERIEQYCRRWYSWVNLLEYFRAFSGQMSLQADNGFVPLGGNTVFIRTALLRKTNGGAGGWPMTLTEDAALGTEATALHGAKVVAFYDPALATLEETPPRLRELVLQRRRWNQGFLQSLLEGQWKLLPTIRQRLLAFWILSCPFLQAASALLLPVTLVTMFLVKSPPALVLMMFVPIDLMAVAGLIQLWQMREFSRSYRRRVPWHVYLLLPVAQILYQPVLSLAAAMAVKRHFANQTDWHATARSGDVGVVTATQPATG